MAMRSSTRRDFFTAGAATALAGIAAASFAQPETLSAKGIAKRDTHPDARLIALCDAFIALEAEAHALYGHDHTLEDEPRIQAAHEVIFGRQEPLKDEILSLRATTLDGIRAKARAMVAFDNDFLPKEDTPYWNEAMLFNLVRDLVA
ncbi:hypothetical protein HLH33_03000 [Gluconacetobacter diazotrophicus]|uniref:Twin-arginine translocation pathway signal n=1 Tax=Gluconacetobacter diazotrophicus TaxID=33996 RepID=A0A7W4I5C0_GLUDI|nr:hypothetical protein [Gluconacetobacter diazotrophicus]MBB2155285.1 hypothetical protein [Gluconacetobacter diazotrophicus]